MKRSPNQFRSIRMDQNRLYKHLWNHTGPSISTLLIKNGELVSLVCIDKVTVSWPHTTASVTRSGYVLHFRLSAFTFPLHVCFISHFAMCMCKFYLFKESTSIKV